MHPLILLESRAHAGIAEWLCHRPVYSSHRTGVLCNATQGECREHQRLRRREDQGSRDVIAKVSSTPPSGGGGNVRGAKVSEEPEDDGQRRSWTLGTAFFACMLLGGGLAGYIKKSSVKSVIAGGSSAIVMFGASSLMQFPKTFSLGLYIAAGTTLALMIVMGTRFAKSRKFMPSGLLAVSSAIWFVSYIRGILL